MIKLFYLIAFIFIGISANAQVDILDVTPTCSNQGSITFQIDPFELEQMYGSFYYPVTLLWYNPEGGGSTSYQTINSGDELVITLDNLAAGDWQLILRINGELCTYTLDPITVGGYDLHDELDPTLLNPTGDCNLDSNNGSIDLNLSDNFTPLQYSWSSGETTEDISGLSEGTYCVTIVDAVCGLVSECFKVNCQCFSATPAMSTTTFFDGTLSYITVTIPDFSDIPNWVNVSFYINDIPANSGPLVSSSDAIQSNVMQIGDQYCVQFELSDELCKFDICGIVEGQTCPGVYSLKLMQSVPL